MLALNPDVVRFEQWVWEDVAAAAISRAASKRVEDWGDLGPHSAFVDAPELRTTVRVTRRMSGDDGELPVVGTLGTLVFYVTPGATDALRRRVQVRCVLTSVRTEVTGVRPGRRTQGPGVDGGIQTLTFVAVSVNGQADPLSISHAGTFE